MLKYLRMGNKRIKIIWWILVVVTVFAFVGGFIFLFGSGFDRGRQAQVAGALGTVNGENITRAEFQNAIAEQRDAYQRRFGADPGDQEMRTIEAQAWRGVVLQRVMTQTAKKLGLAAHDKEVVISLQASPPQAIASLPDFQTNGKFDPAKYAQALRNPNIQWGPFEEMARQQLPVRKLQERLVASVKLSQPELVEAYRRRFEKINITLVNVPGASDSLRAAPAQADLDRVYEKYRGRFNADARVRLEVLGVPKTFSEEELRVAGEQARDLVNRARQGEDFGQLAKDFSEGPSAAQGGELNRVFQPSEFGPDLAPIMALMQKGAVSDPIPEPGQFLIVKCLDRIADPMSPTPNLRVAQIIIKARGSEETQRQQYETLKKLHGRATQTGLGRAATEKGMSTFRTGFFSYPDVPQQLYDAPDLAEWAVGQKAGAVSPVVVGRDAFFIAQVADRRDAGPAPKEDVTEQLRAVAQAEARVAAARPRAEALMQALGRGQSLENAAAAVGVQAVKLTSLSRESTDPRIAGFPDALGAAFVTPVGKVAGPIATPGGWIVLRVDAHLPQDSTSYDQLKGQITTDILQRRQGSVLQAWTASQRLGAKVQDLRSP